MTLSASERRLIKSLERKKERYATGLFIIDGIKPVEEALMARQPLRELLYMDDLSGTDITRILTMAQTAEISCRGIPRSQFRAISSLEQPEGVVAVAPLPTADRLAPDSLDCPAVLLWQINDPGNLGALLRASRWFGVRTVCLSIDSVDVYNPKVVRASAGALFHLQIRQDCELAALISAIRRAGGVVYATDAAGQTPLESVSPPARWGLLLGSESHGLPRDIQAMADDVLRIPRPGSGESLNVAMAAGIMLYHLVISGRASC